MYIKIVRHLEDEQGVSNSRGSLYDKVVPSLHHMFECLEAEYRKVAVNNMDEFHDRMNSFETHRIVTPMPDMDSPFEFIQIKTTIKEDDDKFVGDILVGKDCVLFIMNDDGKTIDSMVCQ